MDDRLTEDLPFKVLRREWQPVAISVGLKQGQVKSLYSEYRNCHCTAYYRVVSS